MVVNTRSAGSGFARRGLLTHCRGVVAAEFAILAIPLFIMLLGVMELGYDFFVQEALDSAVETAARQVQIGNVQCGSNAGSAKIVAAVCPVLSALLSCNALTVGVQQVGTGSGATNYYNTAPASYAQAASKNGDVTTGSGGAMMLLEGWYNGPTFLGTLIPYFASIQNGQLVHQTYASAAFVDEYFTGTAQTSGSCS